MTSPKKIGGYGPYRHCFPGQEAKLTAILLEKGMSLDQFNQAWDHIEQQNRDHQLSTDEHSPEYRQAVTDRIRRIIQDARR